MQLEYYDAITLGNGKENSYEWGSERTIESQTVCETDPFREEIHSWHQTCEAAKR